MADSLSSTILGKVVTTYTKDLDLRDPVDALSTTQTLTFTTGTTAGKANLVFADTRSLASSATESLDLAGSLTDAFGTTLAFARIKAIFIRSNDAVTANTSLLVGGAASNQFTNWVGDVSDKVRVRPGGFLLLGCGDATGYAVTAGTGDLLKIANESGDTTASYDIILLGADA